MPSCMHPPPPLLLSHSLPCAGQVSVPLLVSFAAPEREGLAVPPVELTLKATGRELPVTTLTPVVDFK